MTRVTLLLPCGEVEVDLSPDHSRVCLECGAVDPPGTDPACQHGESMDAAAVLRRAWWPGPLASTG